MKKRGAGERGRGGNGNRGWGTGEKQGKGGNGEREDREVGGMKERVEMGKQRIGRLAA